MHILTLIIASLIATTQALTHNILVGQSGLTFTPNTTYASVNDKIQFIFYPQNHNVVQGPYSTPCLSGDNTGFYSGFIPSTSGAANRTFEIAILDTQPIWFYCSALGGPGHCTAGMVGVINPPSNTDELLSTYKTNAAEVKKEQYEQPGKVQGGVLGAYDGSGSEGNGTATWMNGTMTASSTATSVGVKPTSASTGVKTSSATVAATPTPTNAGVVMKAGGLGAVLGGLAVMFL